MSEYTSVTTDVIPIVSADLLKDADQPRRPQLMAIAGKNAGELYPIGSGLLVGRSKDVDVPLFDDGISRRHLQLTCPDDEQVYVEDLGSTNGTYVNGEKIAQLVILQDGDKIRLGQSTIFKFTYHDELEESFQRELYASALRDGLTGLFNRRYLDERLETEVAFARRHETPLTVILLDLDCFKRINDRLGHPAGDAVLRNLGRLLSDSVRKEDVTCRYGGEEFAIVCRGIVQENGMILAERLRYQIEKHPFEWEGETLQLTVSIGVAAMPHKKIDTAASLLSATDKVLYSAKRAGRNRIEAFL